MFTTWSLAVGTINYVNVCCITFTILISSVSTPVPSNPSIAPPPLAQVRVGRSHRELSPSTYLHLLLEAHLVLTTALYAAPLHRGLRAVINEFNSM